MRTQPTVAELFSDDFPGVDAYSWTDEQMEAFFDRVWACVKERDQAAWELLEKVNEGEDSRLKLQEWQVDASNHVKTMVVRQYAARYGSDM